MRALGASKKSVTLIFLFTGLGIGLAGSLFGAGLACLTLHYLPEILACIGTIQGHEILSSSIYGEIAAQKISLSTLFFTLHPRHPSVCHSRITCCYASLSHQCIRLLERRRVNRLLSHFSQQNIFRKSLMIRGLPLKFFTLFR